MRRRLSSRALILGLLVCLPLVASCGDSTGPPPVGAIVFVGAPIFGQVGSSVTVQVRVEDESGNPIRGIEVVFTAASGSVNLTSVQTRTGGLAQASWILGTSAGTQTLRVDAGSRSLTVVAEASAGPATSIEIAGGDGQTGPVGQELGTSLTVQVEDAFQNPVPGVPVGFAAVTGGGWADPSTGTTNQSGQAATVWTLGQSAGAQSLEVRIQGGPSVRFEATALADAPAVLSILAGDGQTGPVGEPLSEELAVQVTDQFGNAVLGAAVGFTVVSGGGTTAPAVTESDASGRAATTFTLGPRAGEQSVRAHVEGAKTAVFNATATAGEPQVLVKASGDGQVAYSGAVLAEPLVVEVQDGFGNPVSAVPLVFSPSHGEVTPSEGHTGEDGRISASWVLGAELGEQAVEVTSEGLDPVTFLATAASGSPADISIVDGDGQSATVGTELPGGLVVQVRDGSQNPVPGAVVTFAVTSGGGSADPESRTTDQEGRAGTSWTLGEAAGAQTLEARVEELDPAVFSATALSGEPASVTIVSGNDQTGAVVTLLPEPLVVEVRDDNDNLVPGATVTFQVTEGGGSVTAGSVTSDAQGRGSTQWTLGETAGEQFVEAHAGTAAPATFTATAQAGAATEIQTVRGDGQRTPPATPVPIPPQVRVVDEFGNPVSGVQVTFAPAGEGGSVESGVRTSDARGLVSVGEWTLGGAPGEYTLSAAADDLPGVTFTATAEAIGESYDVEVRFVGNPPDDQIQAFLDAESRWERIIVGGLPEVQVNLAAGDCGIDHPAINESIDDVVIFAQLDSIDGENGILGQAGPCISQGARLSVVGVMLFDTADLAVLNDAGYLDEVVVHEMAHALGFVPSVWSALGLIAGRGTSSTRFLGPGATARYEAAGGVPQGSVPLEEGGGAGTRDAHWDEDIFDNELMTGFLDSGANPLSAITAAALWDMGYTMDVGPVDPYTIPGSALRADIVRYLRKLRELPPTEPRRVGPDGRPLGR